MNSLTELLNKPRFDGYPLDFTLARLRSRSADFSSSCPIGGGEAAWQQLQEEYCWLYSCLDPGMRKELAPVFLCFELRNIFASLRYAKNIDQEGIEAVLRFSMLSPVLKKVFIKSANLGALLQELSHFLSPLDEGFASLGKVYRDEGLSQLEKVFLNSFLSAVLKENRSILTTDFILRIMEKRNLMLLAKEKRWKLEKVFLPVTEGRRALKGLERKSLAIDARHPGAAAEPARMDNLLHGQIAKDYRRQRRNGQALAALLDYILSCYLAARNCGVKGLEPILGNARTVAEIVV